MQNEKAIELKPCPFCGHEAKLTDHGKGTGGWMVSCNNHNNIGGMCGVLMVCPATYTARTENEIHDSGKTNTIKAWNQRQALALLKEKPVRPTCFGNYVESDNICKKECPAGKYCKPSDWIPVSERLPEVGQWVLCNWPSDFDKDEPFSITKWWQHTKEEKEDIIFSHWMPIILPEPEKPVWPSKELKYIECKGCKYINKCCIPDANGYCQAKKPTCETCEGSGFDPNTGIGKPRGFQKPCPDCPPKEDAAEFVGNVRDALVVMDSHEDGANGTFHRRIMEKALDIIESLRKSKPKAQDGAEFVAPIKTAMIEFLNIYGVKSEIFPPIGAETVLELIDIIESQNGAKG